MVTIINALCAKIILKLMPAKQNRQIKIKPPNINVVIGLLTGFVLWEKRNIIDIMNNKKRK